MTINYSQLVSALQNLLVDDGSTNFTAILPQAISYAEDRCYRELDFLANRATDTSVTLTAGSRNATCPADINVVEGIALLNPAGQLPPSASRIVLERSSLDFIDSFYGSESDVGTPQFYALKNDIAIVLAPSPMSPWIIEITGTIQPAAMSNSNTTTVLGNYFPDLMLAACMVFLTGWQQNFGAQADNPQMAQSWETQYGILKTSALEFIQRQKSQDPNWTPFTPTPLSTPRT